MEIPGNEFRVKSKVIQDRVKVSGKESAKINQLDSSGNKGAQGAENIVLSSKAKDIQKSHAAIKSSSDIRIDKVEQIKAAISDGTFHVDSQVLAEKMLKEIITESNFID